MTIEDFIVAIAFVATGCFTYTALNGNDTAAAWFALALALTGVARLVSIVVVQLNPPDY